MINNINFEQFEEFVLKNENTLIKNTGECDICNKKRKCHNDNRIRIINAINNLSSDVTRFPILLNITNNIPFLLKLVPNRVFEKMYGFYCDHLPCPFASNEVVKNLDKIKRVYSVLTDQKSKKTLLNLLMYRITLEKNYVDCCVCNEKQYFIEPYCNLGSEEVVVDCGGFIGDTLEEYLKNNNPPRKYYIYEPDIDNIEKIKKMINNLDISTNIIISQKGVYKKNANLWLKGGEGSSSHISEERIKDAQIINVACIDEIDDNISFIKMDIEGFEKYAIEGAKENIIKNYPKLAICIYHSINDLWEIPLQIIKNFPEYNNLLIRQYNDNCWETVFYAYKE